VSLAGPTDARASGGGREPRRLVSLWYRPGMALTLRTDDELERALAALAESEGLSRQEVIRRAVLERYERAGHRARVEDSAQRMVDRWGDVIERLGSV
jgi:predicted transcriptional regulator